MSTRKLLAKNSLQVALLLGLSTVLGFMRESVIAYKFGAGGSVDAYLIAMIIPTLFINLVKVSVTNTFVPVFTRYLKNNQVELAWEMTNTVISVLFVILVSIMALLFAASAELVNFVAPSYAGPQAALTVKLSQLLLPTVVFSSLLGILVGVNNAHYSFFAPSAIGVVSNLITIVSTLVLGGIWGIYGLAAGTVIGVITQFLIQIPSMYKHGFSFRFQLNLTNPGVREMMLLIGPFILSGTASQISLVVNRVLAAGLPSGAVSALYFANRLVSLPQNVFATAVGMVVYPVLVSAVTQRDWHSVVEGLNQAIRLLLLILLPAAAGIFVLREPLVQLFFQHGAFSARDTAVTADTVPFFLGTIIFQAMLTVLVNICYATRKMWTAISAGAIAVGVNVVFSLLLVHPLQQKGLALANSLSAVANVLLVGSGVYRLLSSHVHVKVNAALRSLADFVLRVGTAVIIMGVSVLAYRQVVFTGLNGRTGLVLFSLSAVAIGLFIYTFMTYILRVEEVNKGMRWAFAKAHFRLHKPTSVKKFMSN